MITPTNLNGGGGVGHIGYAGAIRLAKAMWWMLARIAGWDGGTTSINDQNPEAKSMVTVVSAINEIRISLDETLLPVTLRLYNLQGGLIFERKVDSNLFTLQVSHLYSGIYFIVVSNSKFTETREVVIT